LRQHEQHHDLTKIAHTTSEASTSITQVISQRHLKPPTDASATATMSFRLLDLPAEIRLRIHAALLVQRDPIRLENRRSGTGEDPGVVVVRFDAPKYRKQNGGQVLDAVTKEWEDVRPSAMALLRTCKSVRTEACEVAYGQNTFSFLNMATGTRFMELIGSAMKFVRYVVLQPKGYGLAGAPVFFNRLARASNLRLLQVSHTDCCEREEVIDDIALHSTLMLSLLQHSYEQREIAGDVLDVI